MIISIGSDHAGYELKSSLLQYLGTTNDVVINDVGTFSTESCDYPDFARKVCEQILENEAEIGILICATGIGMSISANRNTGIRAALCTSELMAQKSRQHNDANILVLGTKNTDINTAIKILQVFINGKFEGGRHTTRLNKI